MKKTAPTKSPPTERDATAAEMRALGHPLRWRILRVTLNEGLTNKEIAERLGRDPGTVLYHVRVLVREGFLVAERERAGRRGARERPYRASGKSWRIRLKPDAGNVAAILDATREEVVERGADAAISTLRLGLRLKPRDIAALRRRISALGDEFEPRDDPAGEPIGIVAIVHRRRP
jgi:DNA-binding transcriptional ArsR family regulator